MNFQSSQILTICKKLTQSLNSFMRFFTLENLQSDWTNNTVFHYQLFQENQMSVFVKKLSLLPLLLNYSQIRIILKNSTSSAFDDYWTLALYKRSKKSNEKFLRKTASRQTDRQTHKNREISKITLHSVVDSLIRTA